MSIKETGERSFSRDVRIMLVIYINFLKHHFAVLLPRDCLSMERIGPNLNEILFLTKGDLRVFCPSKKADNSSSSASENNFNSLHANFMPTVTRRTASSSKSSNSFELF